MRRFFDMSDGQYRALVAYLNYWPSGWKDFDFQFALDDIGISLDKETVLDQLSKAGHDWDDDTLTLHYED